MTVTVVHDADADTVHGGKRDVDILQKTYTHKLLVESRIIRK